MKIEMMALAVTIDDDVENVRTKFRYCRCCWHRTKRIWKRLALAFVLTRLKTDHFFMLLSSLFFASSLFFMRRHLQIHFPNDDYILCDFFFAPCLHKSVGKSEKMCLVTATSYNNRNAKACSVSSQTRSFFPFCICTNEISICAWPFSCCFSAPSSCFSWFLCYVSSFDDTKCCRFFCRHSILNIST